MPIDPQTLKEAKDLDRPALQTLLATVYPMVHRMAYALSGREDVGRGIVRFVVQHSLQNIAQWRDPDSADRWFYHFTVLTSRRAQQHAPNAQRDTLVAASTDISTAYVAFIAGLRALPFQQREAFLLTHGEHLGNRLLAIAMDCSTSAAEVHLRAATDEMKKLSGRGYEEMRQRLQRAYAALTPDEERIQPSVRTLLSRALWPRRVKRIVRMTVTILILMAIAYLTWRFRHLLPWKS